MSVLFTVALMLVMPTDLPTLLPDCTVLTQSIKAGTAGRESEWWSIHLSLSRSGLGHPFVPAELHRRYCRPAAPRGACVEYWIDEVMVRGVRLRLERGCN